MFQLSANVYDCGFPGQYMQGSDLLDACWDRDTEGFLSKFHESHLSRYNTRRRNISESSASLNDRRVHLERLLSSDKDGFGNGLLHVCAYRGAVKIMEFILEGLGPNSLYINVLNSKNITPLHVACRRPGNAKTINLLLKYHADPTSSDINGYTPLHLAADSNAVDAVETILVNGVDPNVDSCAGVTPLVIACREGYVDLACLLARHGADICKKSTLHDGITYLTPFSIAQSKGWGERLRGEGAVPDRPEAPYVSYQNDHVTKLQWHAPAGRSAPVEFYKLEIKRVDCMNPEEPWKVIAASEKLKNFVLSTCKSGCSSYDREATEDDLLPNEVYVARVSAYSMVGWSNPSKHCTPFVTVPGAPVTPDAPVVIHKASTSVTIQWTNPDCSGAPIDKSHVQWMLSHSATASWTDVPHFIPFNMPEEESSDSESEPMKRQEMTEYTVEGLASNFLYKFRVRVHNCAGWSYFSHCSSKVKLPQDGTIDKEFRCKFNTGMRLHAEARMYALKNSTAAKKLRSELSATTRTKFHRDKAETAASILIQAAWRGRWTRCKYLNFLRDWKERRVFLVEYDMEKSFRAEYKKLLLRYKTAHDMAEGEHQTLMAEKSKRKRERAQKRHQKQLLIGF